MLLGYSLVMGLTAPVGPGVALVEPAIVEHPGNSVPLTFGLDITGYNTHFSETNPTKVWLKYGKFYLCPEEINIVSADRLRAKFMVQGVLPDSLKGKSFHMVLQNEEDGLFLGVSMVTIKTADTIVGGTGQMATSCLEPKSKAEARYFSFPYRGILHETIRNLNYHVPMWFTMIALLLASFVYSILYLRTLKPDYDLMAGQLANVGVLFGFLGLATGSFWARFTWGAFWSPDPKLNGAAIGVLIYIAYNILRRTVEDRSKVGRLAAVYNIMAFLFSSF